MTLAEAVMIRMRADSEAARRDADAPAVDRQFLDDLACYLFAMERDGGLAHLPSVHHVEPAFAGAVSVEFA